VSAAIAQAPPKQNAQPATSAGARPQLAEEVFKDIRLLKGMPVDEFMDTMGFFSASTTFNCIDCHGNAAGGDWAHYADETPKKTTARKMIQMVQTINRQNFNGVRLVSCYTCHHGDMRPAVNPSLAVQYAAPVIDPDESEVTSQDPQVPGPDQIFSKYIDAIGGAQKVGALNTLIAKGNYKGYDTEFEDVPVEIYSKAPVNHATVIHFRAGDSITTFDGKGGWISENDKPVPLIQQTGGELEGARVDGAISFPSTIRSLRTKWFTGATEIDDKDVILAQGIGGGSPTPLKLYFDKQTGLLVRQVRYVQLNMGRVPAQIDYEDYREIPGAGVKVPFKVTSTWVDGRSTATFTEVQANQPIPDQRFAKPAVVAKAAAR
jgi:hypothetical protein